MASSSFDITDPWAELGSSSDAGAAELRRAYLHLALKNHPDKGGDAKVFQRIRDSYEMVTDPDQRAYYLSQAAKASSYAAEKSEQKWEQWRAQQEAKDQSEPRASQDRSKQPGTQGTRVPPSPPPPRRYEGQAAPPRDTPFEVRVRWQGRGGEGGVRGGAFEGVLARLSQFLERTRALLY